MMSGVRGTSSNSSGGGGGGGRGVVVWAVLLCLLLLLLVTVASRAAAIHDPVRSTNRPHQDQKQQQQEEEVPFALLAPFPSSPSPLSLLSSSAPVVEVVAPSNTPEVPSPSPQANPTSSPPDSSPSLQSRRSAHQVQTLPEKWHSSPPPSQTLDIPSQTPVVPQQIPENPLHAQGSPWQAQDTPSPTSPTPGTSVQNPGAPTQTPAAPSPFSSTQSHTLNGKGWTGKTEMWASQKEHRSKDNGGNKPLKNWCAIKEGRSAMMLDADPVPEGAVPALSPRHIPTSVLQLRQEIQTGQGSSPKRTGEAKRKKKRLEIELNQGYIPKALQDLERRLRHKVKTNHELEDLETRLKISQELDNVGRRQMLRTDQQELDSEKPQNYNTRHDPEIEVPEQHLEHRGGERRSHEPQNQKKDDEEEKKVEGVVVVEEKKEELLVNPETLGLPEGCEYMERGIFTSVVCSGANITTVPNFPLSNHLESLHFYGTGIQMVSDISGLPRSLHTLAFTWGQLALFDGRQLYQIPDLESILLDHNTLTGWSFYTTFYNNNPSGEGSSNTTITYLSLQDNLITYPPEPAGGNGTVLPLLKTLDMSDNPMCNLPTKLFLPLASSPVTSLLLRNCSLSQIPQSGSPLEPLPNLEVLDLSNNMGLAPDEVHQLLQPLQDGGHLTHLALANNNYRAVPTEALQLVSNSLKVLDLHGSAFECLDNTSFPYFPRLLHLNLMYCRIQNIQPDTFDGFPVLEVLNLDGNGLITIPTEVLLPSLKVLTLSENPRSTGSGSPETFTMNQVDFGSMTSLTNLTFQEVPLGGVEVSYFNDLSSLRELRLTACKISFIDAFSFVNLSKLEWLYLNQNELSVLKNDTFTGLVSLIHLDLSHNSIVFRSGANIAVPPKPLYFLQPIMAVAEGMAKAFHQMIRKEGRGQEVNGQGRVDDKSGSQGGTELSGRQVVEAMRSPTAKEDASLTDTTMTESQLVLSDGREEDIIRSPGLEKVPFFLPFQGLRSLQHLDLSCNEVWAVVADLWQDLHSLVTLDLTSNDIKSWYNSVFSNLTNLTELWLAKNSLDVMTEGMVKDFSSGSLAVIDLRANPFECSCQMKQLFNSTFNTTIFVDFTSYQCTKDQEVWMVSEFVTNSTCRGETITTTTTSAPKIGGDDQPSDRFKVEYIIITSVLLSVVMTSATLYKKRWYIRYLVHKARAATTLVVKEDNQHYLYDTFVCYSQADRQWVFEHLVARLEGDGRYRVCVHERDFAVGQEITDNIITSIEKSRKVVMVLSPAFVDSSWCMFELQLASNKILDERRNKLILVVLKALTQDTQPKKLRLLLRTRTYLPWVEDSEGQRLFWAKLMRVVAKPTASEAPLSQEMATTHL